MIDCYLESVDDDGCLHFVVEVSEAKYDFLSGFLFSGDESH
jgi:hypothetical protein